MKEYLKMADVFGGDFGGDIDRGQGSGWTHKGKYVPLQTIQQYVSHAVNSHDELVAEVKKLRSELADAWFMVDEIKLSLDRRSRQAEYWESIAKE